MKKSELIEMAEVTGTKIFKTWTKERITESLLLTSSKLNNIIKTHEKWSSSYFMNWNNKQKQFKDYYKFGNIEVEQEMTASCKNTYYSLDIRVDGIKKDIRVIKKLMNKLEINN